MRFLRKWIRIKTSFSWGQYEPYVSEKEGLKDDSEEFYGI